MELGSGFSAWRAAREWIPTHVGSQATHTWKGVAVRFPLKFTKLNIRSYRASSHDLQYLDHPLQVWGFGSFRAVLCLVALSIEFLCCELRSSNLSLLKDLLGFLDL
ncbi:hypothetical protein AAC387_Pa11g2064 [Persea americana]